MLSTTFNQLEVTILSRQITFVSSTYVQALNGEILNGQLACYLSNGEPFAAGTIYNVLTDFHNCSTADGGFSVVALASTASLSTLYFYYGVNGPCSVLYGPLPSPATQATPLQGNSLSVGGAVYVRLGGPGCDITPGASSACAVMPPFTDGVCDSAVGDEAEVALAGLDFSITDPDGLANTMLEFSIVSGNQLGHFDIDTSSGMLSIRNPVDRDAGPSMFTLGILVVNDPGEFNTTLTTVIFILDENDNSPIPAMRTFAATIIEDVPIDTFVLTAIFTDQDDGVNALLRYAIDPPSPDFALLDSSIANITTSREFDFEAGDRFFSFVITAQDSSSSPVTGSASVLITISDANDNRPQLDVVFREGAEYVEDFDPVSPATVVLMDDDSALYPLLYAVVTILDPLDQDVELLNLPQLPDGYRVLYSNFTLLVVGSGSPSMYASLLSNVMYENLAILFQTPLLRNISYAVCDGLRDNTVLSMLSADTAMALLDATATNPILPFEDALTLLDGCVDLVGDELQLPLIETNDRPQLVGAPEFPPVSEDATGDLAENRGVFVVDVFDDVITDTDRDSVTGIAVVDHGSLADPQSAQVGNNDACFNAYVTIASMGVNGCQGQLVNDPNFCGCPVSGSISCLASPTEVTFVCIAGANARFCTCPLPSTTSLQPSLPEYSNINILSVQLDAGTAIDLTSILIPGRATSYAFGSSALLFNFVFSVSIISSNLTAGGEIVNSSSFIFSIIYTDIGDVSEDSALVLGPYSLIRWVPRDNLNGITYLTFRGWDTSDGESSGTRDVDTTLSTAYSLEVANATVAIVAENDPPVIRLGGPGANQMNYSTAYTEGGASVSVSDRRAVVLDFDEDDLFLYNLTVSISGIGGSCDLPDFLGDSQDVLSYLNGTVVPLDEVGIERSGQACITYSFLGVLSVDQWRSFITMVRFSVEDPEPSEHTRELTFAISDRSSTSELAYTTVDVTLVSDMCPVISLAAGPMTYREHSPPVVLDASLVVTDGDRNPEIASARVQIMTTPNDPCTTCELDISASNLPDGVTATVGPTTMLTITGAATPEQYQALLRTVSFQDTGDEPSFNLAMVRFTLQDPSLSLCPGAMADIGVLIEHVNDNSPFIYLNYPNSQDFSATFTEGAGTVRVTAAVRIIDNDGLDSDLYRIVVSIELGCVASEDRLDLPSVLESTLVSAYDQSTCSLTVEGSVMALEGDLTQLEYRNINIENPSPANRSIVFAIMDASLNTTSAQSLLQNVPLNDRPIVDLDVSNLVSSNAMVILREVESGSITPGAAVIDPDNAVLVSMTLVLTEVDIAGGEVARSDQAFEALGLTPSMTFGDFGVSGTFVTETGGLFITGLSSVENYTAILNNIVYSNRRLPPSDGNRRRVSVTVSDGDLTSLQVFSTIALNLRFNPPMLDLNGEPAGTDVQTTYTITNPPLPLFPTASLSDIDGDHICTINITMMGSASTCLPNSIEFSNAYSSISIDATTVTNGVNYLVTTAFSECLEAIVFEDVLRGVRFSILGEASPGSCTLMVSATEVRGLVSNVAMATVEVRAFNAAPFIDLDLGLSGRDYSTIYFQGGRTQHIVSIFDADRARNITDMTVVGEAMDVAAEAPMVATSDVPSFDDGTLFNGVVIVEESFAGYVLRDVDSPTLTYLQVEFFAGTNLEQDVISFPCEVATPIPAYGCRSINSNPNVVLAPRCNNSVFDACTSNVQDLCSDLQVTIFCSTVGRKAYRFEYLNNGLTSRYETLLGLLGYDFLPVTGGQINQLRLLNISVLDPLSEMANPLAVTRIRIQNQDVLIIEVDPPSFIVYEDERPLRTCNLYTVRVRRLDGTIPEPSELALAITQGNTGEAFGIREDGVIFLNRAVDREVLATYNLVVTARIRTADPDTTASAQLTANVIDVNDNHPITADSYTVNVTEGSAGARVVQILASDADEGQNADLAYLLLGIGAELFQVDEDGLVTTRVALNRTIEDYYLLVMIIMDRGEIYLSTHTVINVNVVTPAPTALEFIPFQDPITVREDTLIGTTLTSLLAVEVGGVGDPATIRYRFVEIISDSSGLSETPPPFIIDVVTGAISVNSGLDSERSSSYSALVEAFSVATLFAAASGFANVTFVIQDVNEFPPMFVGAPYVLSVAENTAADTTLITFVATDNDDMNRGLVYSLSPGTPSSLPFQVEADGDLVVVGDLDFEQTESYSFDIAVRDDPSAGMVTMRASASVVVTVLDRNDNPPVFLGTPYSSSVVETAPDGFVVFNFSTSDADSPINSMVTYSIDLQGTPLCLSGMTIVVCNDSLLTSIEMEDIVFQGTLIATNNPGPGGTQVTMAMEPISIALVLFNEFAPEVPVDTVVSDGFLEEHCGRGPGNTCVGVPVFDFSEISSDSDGGAGGVLSYFLLSTGVPFSLNQLSGALSISERIDREMEDLYSLQVEVRDGGDITGNSLSVSVNITVPIFDIDDNPPEVVPFQMFNVTEQMTTTRNTFGVVSVEDPDINGTKIYQVISAQDPQRSQGCLTQFVEPDYLPVQIDRLTGELSFCESVDFETDPTVFDFTVEVSDNGNIDIGVSIRHFDREQITVRVIDSNDNTPSFPAGQNLAFMVSENAAANTSVGAVRAEDIDSGINGELVFAVVNGSTASLCLDEVPFFTTQTSNNVARILQCQGLDYEMQQTYAFMVQASDRAPIDARSASIQASLTVLDRNDNPPMFESDSYTMNIRETDSSQVMSAVLRISVTDLDSAPNAESVFAIISPSPSPFGLRSATSNSTELFVANPAMINFESNMTRFEVTVEAVNAPASPDDETQRATTIVTVIVTDVNDNSPVITPATFSVRENQPEGTVVGMVVAMDVDTGIGGQLNYYIGNAMDNTTCLTTPFMINVTTGYIATCQALDFESVMSYSFHVEVCDRADPPICSNAEFTVQVVDLNDNSPVYDEDPFIVNLNEHSPNGTLVDIITSTDADSTANSLVSYSLVNPDLPFSLVNENEVVFSGDSASDIDYEGLVRTYIIAVRGQNPPAFADDRTNIVDVALVVNVVDRNDHPPVFPIPIDSVEINEHSSVGMVVYELSTTDADTLANSAVTYSIVQPNTPFAAEANTIVVQDSVALDYDPPFNARSFLLTIRATNNPAMPDDQVQTADFILSISINDTNDNFPTCIGQNSFMIREDSPVNTGLRQLMARDIDSGMNGIQGVMFFTADTGMGDPVCSEEDLFSIDPDSGSFSVCLPFDYETRTSYDVNFTVCDGGRPLPLCSNCPIFISIIDVNDNSPIVNPPTSFNVSELAPVGSMVGCVDAEDNDSGQNALLEYHFADGEDSCSFATPFAVNESSGCITVCLPLDYETFQSYSFDVNVTDRGSPQLHNVTTFTVAIVNENDHAPMITSPDMVSVIEEAANEFVIRVTSQDIDLPPFNQPSYVLLDDAGGSFSIDATTGAIITTRELDREEQESYLLVVEVSDGLNTNNQTLIVSLIDINDNPPEYLGELTFSFREDFLFQVMLIFRDNDTGINANLTYLVSDQRFEVSSNGVLSNLQMLDRDPLTGGSPQVAVTITARDVSTSPLDVTVTITIIVLDINDNRPILLDTPIMGDIVDGSLTGTSVYTVRADDYDEGANAELRYSLDPSDELRINETTGEIILAQDIFISSDTAERIEVNITASDRGMPTRSTTMTGVFFVVSSRPIFDEALYTFSISENSLNSTVGVVSSTDRDINPFNDVFIYSILSVDPYDAGFSISSDGTIGALFTPGQYLDFEDAMSFNITLGVSRVNLTEIIDNRALVVVTVENANDNVPQLSPMTINASLAENTAVDTVVARAVAIDFDEGRSGLISYNLTGEGAQLFSFRQNGELVLREASIDFENTSSYQFVFQACDSGSPQLCSEPGIIFIAVVNLDDLPPMFSPTDVSVDISEGVSAQSLVLLVNITDEDTPLENLDLFLVPPQPSFSILLLSGSAAIMTTDIGLDRETQDMYHFSAVARDPAMSQANATITIRILDENDERPRLEPDDLVVEFMEEGPPVLPDTNLIIVDRDILSAFPLSSVDISLQQDPSSVQGYPNPGGVCDHANSSLLYDNNTHTLCGEEDCVHLLREGDLDIREGGVLQDGILSLPGFRSTARNPVHVFDGMAFETFSITLWVRFPAPTEGNIFEVQSPGVNVFEMFVGRDGSLSVLIRTAGPAAPPTSLISTGRLDTYDGNWHQIGFVRNDSTLEIFFDCLEVASEPDSNEIRIDFTAGSFFLGFGLGGAFVSEFYFCSLIVVNPSHICCTLTCGEFLGVSMLTPNISASVDARTRSVQLRYTGTDPEESLLALQGALDTITYQNVLDEPHPLDRGVRLLASDEVGPSDQATVVTLRPSLINDQRPVLDLNGITEGGIDFFTTLDEISTSSIIIGDEAFLYDTDSGFWPIASVRVELSEVRGHALQVLADAPPGLTYTLEQSDRILNIFSPSGTTNFPGMFVDFLQQVRYANMQEEQDEFDVTIRFTVIDNAGHFNNPLSVTTITVLPFNDGPVLDLDTTNPASANSQVNFMESEGIVNILSGTAQSITDPDNNRLDQAEISFTTRHDGDSESLRLDPGLTVDEVSSVFDPSGVGVLTVDRVAEFPSWLAILRSVQYVNTEQNPDDDVPRQVSIVIRDTGGAVSQAVFVEIVLVAANDPPELLLGGVNPDLRDFFLNFTEDGPCVPVAAPDLVLRDADSTGIRLITISIADNRDLEAIEFNGTGPSDFVLFTDPSGTIILIPLPSSSIAGFEQVLRNLVYCNLEDEPDEIGGRTITFTVTDNGLTTSSGRTTPSAASRSNSFVNIVRVNDRPMVSFVELDDISIRNTPTAIINSSSIMIDDSDDDLFDQLRIYITNPQNDPADEIIEFFRQLPESSISRGPTVLPGPQFLYTVTFTGGADVDRVTETISELRYNNNADPERLTVDPPRQICVDLSDFKIFSPLTCVNVTISPSNNFAPVFDPATVTIFTIPETSEPFALTTVHATDDDALSNPTSREGSVVYSIQGVRSFIRGSLVTTTSIFRIDSMSGDLTVPNGLDAEDFTRHEITVTASDQGNPVQEASIALEVNILDINDVAPIFTNTPYVAPPMREELDPPNVVFVVRAVDTDISNVQTVSYSLLNFQDRFSINEVNGVIQHIVQLNAEDTQSYVLNVSATDSGSPPLVSYATVTFSLIETNDNSAFVDQLTPAVYVVDGGSSSIGPAIRITDADLGPPAISRILVVLTQSGASLRTYDQCLALQCQDARLSQANLLPPAQDLLQLATFVRETRTTVGDAECPAVTIRRDDVNRELDGYGEIQRGALPNSFASGEFSVSFVLTQESEGFILLVPDSTDVSLLPAEVNREFGIWIRRRDFRFYYLTSSQSGEQVAVIRLTSATSPTQFFTPGSPQTRHFTVVVTTAPARVMLYVDCVEVGSASLLGDVMSPNPNINVFIGRSQPHPVNGGRLSGQLHGLYYHPTALTGFQITDFCSCVEVLVPPPALPPTVTALREVDDVAQTYTIILEGVNGLLIPNPDAIAALRAINYTNQFDTSNPARSLTFTITEETGVSMRTFGTIRLVRSDDNPPVVDLNGFGMPGLGSSATFLEDGLPVSISPDADVSRDIDGFSINPTFSNVEVRLVNGLDDGEVLSATASEVISVEVSDDGRTLNVVGPGIPTEFNSVLQTVQYANLDDNPTVSQTRRVVYQAYDTEGRTNVNEAVSRTNVDEAVSIITLTSLNDPPQLSLDPDVSVAIGNVEYVEGSSGVLVTPNITAMDVDDVELVGAAVTLTSPMLSLDSLSIGNNAGLSVQYNRMTGVLTLSGSASLSRYQTALSALTFTSIDSPFLDTALESLTRTVTVQAFDGQQLSDTVTVQVLFTPNNDPPVITLPSPTVTFRDGDIRIQIAPSADITDSDNRQLERMTVELVGGLDNNILMSGTRQALVLVFNRGSVADYISILRSITYVNMAAEPTLVPRRIDIEVCDIFLCSEAIVTVEIEDVNDNSPMFFQDSYEFNLDENMAAGTTVGTLTVRDADVEDTVFTFTSDESFFQLRASESSVSILTTLPLDFEGRAVYQFTVTASDGINTGSVPVTVDVINVNEPPELTFDPANPALVIGPASTNQLIQVGLMVTDPDVNELIPTALLTLRDVPEGSNETLVWTEVPGYTFTDEGGNVYRLMGPGDPTSLEDALRNVMYLAGELVLNPTTIRTVAVVVSDISGSDSLETVVTVSLASIPQFSLAEYSISLVEESIVRDFLQVSAGVESGGDVIVYAVESDRGVVINSTSGLLSLTQAVDREVNDSLIFTVFAIDALPPARTGTATVNITILDLDDVRPSISGLDFITVSPGVAVSPFANVTVSDPDSIGSILVAAVTVFGFESLQPLPFTGRICVDEPNALSKIDLVCGGLQDGLVLLEQPLGGEFSLTTDIYTNDILMLVGSGSHTIVNGDFSRFLGRLNAFTFALWLSAESSGYIAYYGSPDSVERYFAVFYNLPDNQLTVTTKREGVAGLSGQIRISFQLTTNLADGRYHFVMLQYLQNNLICVVDGQLTNSVAVVYKQQPFIGQVFSKHLNHGRCY